LISVKNYGNILHNGSGELHRKKTNLEENHMKTIELFEKAMTEGNEFFKENGFNPTLFAAYRLQKDSGNELIDFSEVIWTQDIEPISEFFKAQGITEFTISSTFSSLIETLAAFEKQGFCMNGLTEVKANYTDFTTGEKKIIPAIRMKLN